MGLEERVYSVLVVSTSEKFNSALLPLLSEVSFSSVHFASGIGAAQRMLTDRSFDFVIVNSPLRDDPGVRFAIDACAAGGTVVLLLVKSEVHPETFDRVWAHGVFTLAKPPLFLPWHRRSAGWPAPGNVFAERIKRRYPSKKKWRRSGLSTAQSGCSSAS